MSRRTEAPSIPASLASWLGALALTLTLVLSPRATAQPDFDSQGEIRESAALSPAEAVEAYMQRLGLKRLLAQDLASKLKSASGSQRVALAERLGKLYVELLGASKTAADRRIWEDHSRELIKLVPEADSFELRLSLTKTLHLQATETVERHRLRMATPEEVTEAERILRSVKPQLDDIGVKINRRIEAMEALEDRGETSERLSDDLADARRVRSQAFYYAGWTDYYLAYLSGSDELAADAQKCFGWLLNSRGGKPPTTDKIPKQLLKYEHVARAVAGTALATSLRGNQSLAMVWLDAIEEAEDLPPNLRDQLVTWRIIVFATSKRWSDLDQFVRVTRHADKSGGGDSVKPLSLVPARLLAVATLEADKTVARPMVEPLSAIALGDLITTGEISQVLDLVQRYGTAPIGDRGFIVMYVRGVQQYEKARDAHKKLAQPESAADGPDPADLPTSDEPTITLYRSAAVMLQGAVKEPDAESFKSERARASMLGGFALFYAGDLPQAADRFAATAAIAANKEQSEEAMWLTVVSLDKAVENGDTSLTKRRDEASAMFLQTHPDSKNAPKLVLRRAMSGALESKESVRILLGVDKDNATYPAARQHAARLLYAEFRAAKGADRDFAATRFVGIAEETLAMDRKVAMESEGKPADEAVQRIVSRVRQILDALLSVQAPDPARAQSAIDTLQGVAAFHKLDLTPFQSELNFRRVQIALAKDDLTQATTLIEQLQAEGGQFASAADQLMLTRALTRRQRNQGGTETTRDVVRYGARQIDRARSEPQAMKDQRTLSLMQTVATAATELWESEHDAAMRDLAVKLDTAFLEAQPRNQAALRRLAITAEAAGNTAKALECWRTLLSGLDNASTEWFEARYHTVRLLADTDAPRAREVMKQHTTLYPDYGPPPWGPKLKELDDKLGKAPSSPAPSKDGPTK